MVEMQSTCQAEEQILLQEPRSYAQTLTLTVSFSGWRTVRKENRILISKSKLYHHRQWCALSLKDEVKMKRKELSSAFLIARKARSRTASGMKRQNAQSTYIQYYTISSTYV